MSENFVRVCISTYPDVLERLDKIVDELKKRGHRNASRSSVIRLALLQLDIENIQTPAPGARP